VWQRSRRLALLYALTPIAIAALVFGWQWLQVRRGGRFPEEGGLALYLKATSPLAITSWGAWLRAQVNFLWQLGGVPCVVAVASTLPVLVRFARGRARDLDRVALLFLWIAVANVFFFAGRSLDHDYYALYFLPWIAVALALGGQALAEWISGFASQKTAAIAAALPIALCAIPAAHGSIARYQARHHAGHEIGLALRAISDPADVIFLAGPYDLQIPYYAERNVFAAGPAAESLRDLFGLGYRRTLVVVPAGQPRPEWVPAMRDPQAWETRGEFSVYVLKSAQ
jgi:hypothetical protein